MRETDNLVRCNNCKHERGLGLDAWCEFGIKKHNIDNSIYCDAFLKRDYNNRNEYKEIEIVGGNQLILWKHDNTGQKFTHTELYTGRTHKLPILTTWCCIATIWTIDVCS